MAVGGPFLPDYVPFAPYYELCHCWGGKVVSVDMKKYPPALLLAFGLLRFDALLWMARTISLAKYMMIAS